MPGLGLQDAYRDPLLTDVFVAFKGNTGQFIAEEVFPMLPVDKETNYVFVLDKENLRAPKNTQRGLYDRAERADQGLTQVPIPQLVERSLEQPVAWKVNKQQQAPFDAKLVATQNVAEKILIEKEVALALYLSTSANLLNFVTLSGTSQWSDITSGISNPIQDTQTGMDAVIQASGYKPNVAVMGRQVFSKMRNHPQVVNRIQYVARATQEEIGSALADLIDVEKVLIGRAIQNTAAEGLADTLGFIWGKNFYLLYVAPTPAIMTASAGYHICIPSERYVDTWTEQAIKADFVRANDYYTRYVVAKECIYAIYNAVA